MLLQGIKVLRPILKNYYAALRFSLILAVIFVPAFAVAENVPLPSKRPQTFYASPQLLKDIRRRGADKSVDKPVYKAAKSKNNNHELSVSDTTKEDVLEHLRHFKLEDY